MQAFPVVNIKTQVKEGMTVQPSLSLMRGFVISQLELILLHQVWKNMS